MRHCLLLLAWVTVLGALGLSPPSLAQQYRSKVLITPDGGLDKGAEMSIDELEKQIGSITAPYAKSSAGRHLARHYVEQKQYNKAIDFYRTALAAEGLSDVANREMLRELAQVYLLQENYSAAARTLERALAIELVPEVTDYLLLAQAHYRMRKYVAVVATLDQIKKKGLQLDLEQKRQALALYYRAGAYAQCESLLRQLLEVEPDNPENWHQLASVYLQQNKKRQALDQLSLAREKGVPFTERDILLLADLQAVNNNPYGAAETLADALARGEIAASGAHYRKLFEFWFQAREPKKSTQALHKAARLTGDIELYLYLAQLQMQERSWAPMHQTMLDACTKQLPDKYVSRANLLLGVSQLKLGDDSAARRSFINATLIGGAGAEAGKWLEFMQAEPATRDEARRIVGACYGSRDKKVRVASSDRGAAAEQGKAAAQDAVQIKTVPPIRLFYARQKMSLTELARNLPSLALQMNIALVKSGGNADGPIHVISVGDLSVDAADNELQLALPLRGSPSGRGRYRIRTSETFKCAYMVQQSTGEELVAAWLRFAGELQAAGYELTDERRVVIRGATDSGDAVRVELQLGIK